MVVARVVVTGVVSRLVVARAVVTVVVTWDGF